ncbi:MAG: histidine kinase, partial [Elusimicrobia bacterium]
AQTARASLLRSLGVLAGGLAHDFNNLMSVVIGRLSLALDEPALGADVRHLLQGAECSAHRASDLSRRLLTLSKGGVCDLRPIDARKLILETAEFALSGSRVVLEASVPEGLWPVNGDTLQLSQVVANISLNARQAMPNGGTLAVTARNIELDSGRHICVEFTDTGPGIPDELLRRIFEPYFTTKDDGSGLGLAVSIAIIERHAGRLEASNRPGGGACFRIHLRASGRPASEAETPPPQPIRGTGRVLVMDDEPEVLSTATLILERAGFEVLQARDGAQALELARAAHGNGRPLRAALLDLNVKGGLGGGEVFGDLRRAAPGVPVVASTGFMTPGLERDLLDQGFTALLPKPYTGRTLAKMMAGVVQEAGKVSGGAASP